MSKEVDKETIIKHAFVLFAIGGIDRDSQSLFAYFKAVFWTIWLTLFCVLNVIEICNTWDTVATLGKGEMIPIITRTLFFLVTYLLNHEKCSKLLQSVKMSPDKNNLSDHFRKQHQKNMSFYLKLIKSYMGFVAFTVLIHIILAVLTKSLPFEIHPFCNEENTVCFLVSLVFQCVAHLMLGIISMGMDLTFIYLVVTIYWEVEAIKDLLHSADLEKFSEKSRATLKQAIDKHVFVISFAEEFRKIYQKVLLMQYANSTFSVCLIWYLMSEETDHEILIKQFIHVSCFMIQASVYSIGGTVVIEQSLSLCESSFSTDWWKSMDSDVVNSISLILLRSQRPLAFTIGGIIYLSRENIISIMKNAMSFSTLMHNLSDE